MVTGATGFVGGHVVRRLVDDGWTVDALVRDPAAMLPDGVAIHEIPGPIDDLIGLVGDLAPTVCFHLATAFRGVHVPADIEPMVTANVAFGTALAEAVSRAGSCTFVNTGTVWQHYDARAYSPVSLYAAMKQAFTDVLRFYQEVADLPVVTLELTDTYGPGDPRPKLLPILLQAARNGTQLQMTDGTQLIDLLHVNDAVRALHRDRGRHAGRRLRRVGWRDPEPARPGRALREGVRPHRRRGVGRPAGTAPGDDAAVDGLRSPAGLEPAGHARRRHPRARRRGLAHSGSRIGAVGVRLVRDDELPRVAQRDAEQQQHA